MENFRRLRIGVNETDIIQNETMINAANRAYFDTSRFPRPTLYLFLAFSNMHALG